MIKYEFRCEICQAKFDSNYSIPKVLICGHTLCSRCVDRMREKNISKCPFDRKPIDFDEEKIANNYYILSLIDGSIKENPSFFSPEVEETFEITAEPVINNPGWKNTLDGFIKGDILYTVESNGFFYCTDVKTGEWWFLYLNQFWGKYFFQTPNNGKMYMIDQYGNLFQIFNKNYYTQIGKKNSWRSTTHVCILNDILYSLESTNKLYETNLDNGKWKEIGAKKENSNPQMEDVDDSNGNSEQETQLVENNSNNSNNNQINTQSQTNNYSESIINFNIAGINIRIPNILNINLNSNSNTEQIMSIKNQNESNYNIKDAVIMISTNKNILISNKKGELYLLNEINGETCLLSSEFPKNIESYSSNDSHLYYFEKGRNVINRIYINQEEIFAIYKSEFEQKKKSNLNSDLYKDLKKEKEFYQKFETEVKKDCSGTKMSINHSDGTNKTISNTEIINKLFNNNFQSKSSINKLLIKIEKFIELDENVIPIKVICDNNKLAITDKKGELTTLSIENKSHNKFQCLFMLRNCHLHNTILVGDGDLVILDPIRLSLNKLNILTGSEVIILHSMKFLSTIKYIFSSNSKIYFIDVSGSLFHFSENDKKIAQIGNNGICRYLMDFAIYKNYIFTIENANLYRTNLTDGIYVELKNEYSSNYKFFFADKAHLVFISKEDEIIVVMPGETLRLKKKIYYENISKMNSITYFKNHLIYYNRENRSIEALNLDKEPDELNDETMSESKDNKITALKNKNGFKKILAENFPDISLFINNYECLACILKDGVIYKLHC
jgi:hypothetical protein